MQSNTSLLFISRIGVLLCTFLCTACFGASDRDEQSDNPWSDSLALSVDTVAFLEPETPSYSDILLSKVTDNLLRKDSAAVVLLLDSAYMSLSRVVSSDSIDEQKKSSRDILLYLDSNRYEFAVLHIDIERIKKNIRKLFP